MTANMHPIRRRSQTEVRVTVLRLIAPFTVSSVSRRKHRRPLSETYDFSILADVPPFDL